MSFYLKIVFYFLFIFQTKIYANYKPTINVLTTMRTLEPSIINNFEIKNNLSVRIDFVGSRNEFETHLKAGLRTYDVVIADERVLERLYLERLLRTLPDNIITKTDNKSPLFKRSKLNEDGGAYLPLFADPMGITFSKKDSKITQTKSWSLLIKVDNNPYWRQRILVPASPRSQFLLALLATQQEITASSWFIPESTTRWFKQIRLQNSNTDLPIELAFLGNKISAAVNFYSDFLRTKRVVPNLDFIIPGQNTFYDRISVAWTSNSVQENLSQKFIQYLYENRDNLAHSAQLVPLISSSFINSNTRDWLLYEEDVPLPKRIESILKDLTQSTNNPML